MQWKPTPSPDTLPLIVNRFEEPRARPLGRRFALPLAGSSIFLAIASGGLGLLVQLFLKDRGAPTVVISAVASLSAAGVLIGSLVWGRISDRVVRKVLLVLTGAGVALATGFLVFLPGESVVVGSSFLRSFMDIGFAAVAMTVVSGASLAVRRGKNLSYISSARSLGFAVGALGSGFVLEALGFRNSFALMATLPLIGLGFLILLPQEPRPTPVERLPSWSILQAAGLTDLYVSTVLRQTGITGAFSLLYVYMATLGISPGLMGVVSSLNTVTQVGALVAFGWVADRIGRRRVFMFGFALSAVVPLLIAFARNAGGMAAAYVALGFSFSSLYIGSTAHIGDRVPADRQGTMLGLYETSRGLGGFLGPIVAGAITPFTGFFGMFLCMCGIAGLGLLVMIGERIRRRIKATEGPPDQGAVDGRGEER
jgi:MFS family permease